MSHSRPLIKLDIDLETGIGALIGPTGVRIPLDEVADVEAAAARGDEAAIAAITAFHGGVLPDDDDQPDVPLTPERARAMLAEQMAHCPDCAANPEVIAAGYMDANGRMVDTTNQMRALRGQAPLRDDSDPNWWHGKRARRQRRGRR